MIFIYSIILILFILLIIKKINNAKVIRIPSCQSCITNNTLCYKDYNFHTLVYHRKFFDRIKKDNIFINKYHSQKKQKKFVFNEMWNFLDYSKIFNYNDFRSQFYKYSFPNKELINWGDKIWFINWFKRNNILGPNYISYTKLDKNIIKDIKFNSYCVKPSHLSENQGIFIVKNNRLIKDVSYGFVKVKNKIPSYIKKFKKNYKIHHSEIYKAMLFFKTIKANWSPQNFLSIEPGYIIEKVWSKNIEIKVFVMLGKVVGFYYANACVINEKFNTDWIQTVQFATKYGAYESPIIHKKGTIMKFNLFKVFLLAEKTAIASGVDFVRIDIVYDDNKYRVNEFTINPAVWGKGRRLVIDNFYKIINFHKNKKNN